MEKWYCIVPDEDTGVEFLGPFPSEMEIPDNAIAIYEGPAGLMRLVDQVGYWSARVMTCAGHEIDCRFKDLVNDIFGRITYLKATCPNKLAIREQEATEEFFRKMENALAERS